MNETHTPDPVDSGSKDRSSAVSIANQLQVCLYLVDSQITGTGSWSGPLAEEIAPGTTFNVTLTPDPGSGSRGSLSYAVSPDAPATTFVFTFGCPQTRDNFATAEMTAAGDDCNYALPFQATVGGKSVFCGCPDGGHPLEVAFTVAYRVLNVAVVAGMNTPVLDIQGDLVGGGTLWTPEGDHADGQGGSTNPGACPFPLSDEARTVLTVVLTNDAQTCRGFRLYGQVADSGVTLQSGKIAGSTTATQLAVPVAASQAGSDAALASINGQVVWSFGTNDPAAASTLLELYWLFGPPTPAWTQGVWVQTLRDIFGALGSTDVTSQKEVANTITGNCFSGFENGKYRKSYALNAMYFRDLFQLWDYYHNVAYWPATGSVHANCVDQQGFVAVCLGAVGIIGYPASASSAFGFVNSTGLIGIDGPCNSPLSYLLGEPLVGENDLDRTWWGDHAFVALAVEIPTGGSGAVPQVILDATLGPHLGDLDADVYVAATIDTQTTLYEYYQTNPVPPALGPNLGPPRALTASGILAAETPVPVTSVAVQPSAGAAEDHLGRILASHGLEGPDGDHGPTCLDWPAVEERLARSRGLQLGPTHVTPGPAGSLRSAQLQSRGETVANLFVHVESAAGRAAAARCNQYLQACSGGFAGLLEPLSELHPALAGDGVALVSNRGPGTLLLLLWRDVFIRVHSGLTRDRIVELAATLVAELQAGTSGGPPFLGPVTVSPQRPVVGELVTISVADAPAAPLQFHHAEPALVLVDRDARSVTFRATAAGTYRVEVFAYDPRSLHASSRPVELQVGG